MGERTEIFKGSDITDGDNFKLLQAATLDTGSLMQTLAASDTRSASRSAIEQKIGCDLTGATVERTLRTNRA